MQRRNSLSHLFIALLCALSLNVTSIVSPVTAHMQPKIAQTVQPNSIPGNLQTEQVLQAVTSTSMKEFSGVHLGNKIYEAPDWTDQELARIDPARGGTWPSIAVIMSNQLYNIDRYAETNPIWPCRIEKARVRLPNVYAYLTRAAQAGVKIIIRIYPSPGNFDDWAIPEGDLNYRRNHILRAEVPAGGNYCHPDVYRNALDLAEEIKAIHDLNVSNGFIEFGFEPANEPNIEWYSYSSLPELFKFEMWTAMDEYFRAVYDKLQAIGSSARLFTPPMAQGNYAEGINWEPGNGYCDVQTVLETNNLTGYDLMTATIGSYHGISWHNYWNLGKEKYASCENGGQHVSYHFSSYLKNVIRSGKPAVITEADLNSSPQQNGNVPNKNADPTAMADSLRHFFHAEWRDGGSTTHYGTRPNIALWLLNDNINDPNLDHNWHEAYVDRKINGTYAYTENQWFVDWYTRPEAWQPHFRVFLGGGYDAATGLMSHALRSQGLLPTQEPYTALGYQHRNGGGGERMTASAQQIAIGADTPVDWVVVELRDKYNSRTILATRSALVQRDGDIVGMDGITPVTFSGWTDSYYVAVRHRNHLGVMTQAPVALTNAPTIDFTDSTLATYGNHAQKIVDRSSTTPSGTSTNEVAMLWGGDANGDHRVIAAGPNNDKNAVLVTVFLAPGNTSYASNYIVTGYHRTDLNLDGRVIAAGPGTDTNAIYYAVLSHPDNPTYNHNFVIDEQLP